MQNLATQGANDYLKRPGTGELKHVTHQEAQRLIEQAPDRTKQLLFKILWQTGARISEVLELTPEDFDFEEGFKKSRGRNGPTEQYRSFQYPESWQVTSVSTSTSDPSIRTIQSSMYTARLPGNGPRISAKRFWTGIFRLTPFDMAEPTIS